MTNVRQILETKGHEVWSVSAEATVYDALKVMSEKNVGALVVLDGGRLEGVISERDYARKVILKGKFSKEMPVREIMSTDVVTVLPNQSIEECMALMTNKRVRHLPVLEGNSLVGVISIGDVVKAIISEQEFTIKQLMNYITGAR
ncbi:MAG: CBS domain-containing protein [Bacteroidota bacterium]|jgi:CBS domain-containing protein